MYDAKSAARVATQEINSLTVKLSAEKQSRGRTEEDLNVARQLLREHTESRMQHFDQSVAVEVSTAVFVTFYLLLVLCNYLTNISGLR